MHPNPRIPEADPVLRAIREAVILNAETGKLTWRERPLAHFDSAETHVAWNATWPGTPAFASVTSKGYLVGSITVNSKVHQLKGHRVVWALTFGAWPRYWLDHINGVRSDNRIANLREATPAQNVRNCALDHRNTTGCAGVSFNKRRNTYEARLQSNGVRVYLGEYRELEAAVAARRTAERQAGLNGSYGRAA